MSIENNTIPLVSVLIRTKNRPESLLRALESVAGQSYPAIEVVVVNDGGNSISVTALAETLSGRVPNIALIKKELEHTEGRSNAANRAMALASGEYFIFLDDDDWFTPDHIEHLAESLKKHSNLIAVYSDTACVPSYDKKDQLLKIYKEEYSRNALAAVNYLPIHSVLFRREAYEKKCRFDAELDVYEDWHFWIQLACHGDFKRVGNLTAYYSSELSGIGIQDNHSDYMDYNAFFFKKAVPYFSPEQIATLQYSYKEFHRIAGYNHHLEKAIEQEKSAEDSIKYIKNDFTKKLEESFSNVEKNILKLSEKQDALELTISKHMNFLVKHSEKSDNHSKEIIEIKNLLWQINHRNEQYHRTIKTSPLLRLGKIIFRVYSKGKTLIRLIKQSEWLTIKEKLGYNFPVVKKILQLEKSHRSSYEKPADNHKTEKIQDTTFHIVTPKHTLFVAELLRKHLDFFGIKTGRIIDCSETHFDDVIHIVIAPQMCSKLPNRYIAFQMEQSVSSRWFNEKYFNILEHSMAILDYSERNIRYIQEMSPIHYKQLYYLPLSNIKGYLNPEVTPEKEYDVVFYGDVRNERRKRFLNAISEKYNTLIINDLFGEELYLELLKAKVLVNIHYYEGALLETTRLYEAISLGIPVITESSTDLDERTTLANLVTVTPIDDVQGMVEAIGSFINNQQVTVPDVEEDAEHFRFYLGRALLGCGLISEEQIMDLKLPLEHKALESGIGLSLPESWERRAGFVNDLPDMCCFPGLRHKDSWKGCAMSYKYLAHQALGLGMKHLEIMEDDVFLPTEARERWKTAKQVFHDIEFTDTHCDLLSGLLADVSDETEILHLFEYQGHEYVVIDRMISAVCNYYGEYPLTLISRWNPHNEDINTNTMDRYLESYRLKVLVPLPFVAGHKPEKQSTLWSFSNETYDDLIAKSAEKLKIKVERFKQKNA